MPIEQVTAVLFACWGNTCRPATAHDPYYDGCDDCSKVLDSIDAASSGFLRALGYEQIRDDEVLPQ